MTPTTERLTAVERREQILQAALTVFAEDGYVAASTEEIARRAGISQPYLFRLYGTKHELVCAAIRQCFADTEVAMRSAARGHQGEEALKAIGKAYTEMIRTDPVRLRAQLHAYAACEHPEIRALVAREFGRLVQLVRELSGAGNPQLSRFFAEGMLLNVLAMMGQFTEPQGWALALLQGCFEDADAQGLREVLGL